MTYLSMKIYLRLDGADFLRNFVFRRTDMPGPQCTAILGAWSRKEISTNRFTQLGGVAILYNLIGHTTLC